MPSFLQGGSARAAERAAPSPLPPPPSLPLLSGSDDDDYGGAYGGDDDTTSAHEHAYVREEYDASTDLWTRYCECGFSETFERM
jgi:hypothetical protein